MRNNICCLLDACTAINLIHIDEDDFLLKKIDKLDLHINDVVFKEIKANINKYKKSDNKIYKIDIAEKRKIIDQKLTFFRGKNTDNGNLFNNVGSDYIEKIKEVTKYTKKVNGELYSTAYALYLSRINEKRVFFYTDDHPASEYFSPFFDYQQIGQIKDSVDLLVLLYWLDEKFTEPQLDHVLSELYSQYVLEVTLLIKILQTYYDNKVDGKFRKKHREIAKNLNTLIQKLNKFDFKGIGEIYSFFERKPKVKEIYKILKDYYSVFELERKSNAETLLNKIKSLRASIGENKIYKWNDLLTN